VWREHRDAQTDIFTHPRLAQLSTEQIFDVLEHKQNEENAYEQIVALVRYLVQIRHVEPETRIYEALLRANADAVNGDGRVVEELWEEMRGKGVKVGKGAYHAALMVCATGWCQSGWANIE
jgi:glycine/D-amino acid oxidase-like deaminating enzyme